MCSPDRIDKLFELYKKSNSAQEKSALFEQIYYEHRDEIKSLKEEIIFLKEEIKKLKSETEKLWGMI